MNNLDHNEVMMAPWKKYFIYLCLFCFHRSDYPMH